MLVPLGVLLVVRLVPLEEMEQHRAAAALAAERPVSRIAVVVIVALWLAAAAVAVAWLVRLRV